ncbi:FAD-dependent oxidoreductase [Terriglobus aquaticus]|uniref:FAD-dependent oxidoreductase n=1 Tax=Terriglobus aquaticus TaxID=940139 RepID=A0ABW9KPG8_9BACT|nr:FAD-dependent oxidoreductase [Terriglobus aquaticus]
MQSTCIIGGGPAGMMLGLLLARAGLPVTVLEKHNDFFRDFRGDTTHPSTLQVMHELGLLPGLLRLPHTELRRASAVVGGRTFPIADFTHLPVAAPFIALMPQWDLLNFLAERAARYPTFQLRMGHQATGLLYDSTGQVSGVTVRTANGEESLRADLVVGCDGRHATSVTAAHLPVVETGVPIDVLWFRIPRQHDDPENGLGYVNFGHLVVLINRGGYFQVGFLIRKDGLPGLQQRGLPAFQQLLARIVPFLAGRVDSLHSWVDIKLLTVQLNHLERWAVPGLLCIGDAAHAMSPVGGIGINIAIQDAIAAANRLVPALQRDAVTVHDLLSVQHYREATIRRTHGFQRLAHKVLNQILQAEGAMRPPLAIRVLTRLPGAQRLAGRLIGMGLQPQHVQTPEQAF